MQNGDLAEDLEGDWSVNFSDRLVPPGGFAEKSKGLLGVSLNTVPAAASLALLQTLRPPTQDYHSMIDVSSRLVSPVVNFQVTSQPDTDILVDVKVDQLLADTPEE